jgi:hypothetical protein
MIESHLLSGLNLLFCTMLAGAVVEDQVVGQTPFRRYFAEDGVGRRIVFYLSGAPSANLRLPWKRPMKAPTAWSIPFTTVSLCFSLPALK